MPHRIPAQTPPNNFTGSILAEVADERHRQLRKWGEQMHDPLVWYGILGEEFGEVGKAINEHKSGEYRDELIQVAAVAVAAVEAMDKRAH